MATVTQHEPQRRPRLRPELDRLLGRLRSRIRSYVALEGAAIVLAVLGGLFWLTLLFDLGWFQLTNLESPIPVRATIVVAALALVAAAAVAFLAMRLLRRLRPRALALVLERRFPELDERLILAVETVERIAGEPMHGPLEEAMLARAIDDAADAADRLDVADVFDRRPLRRASIVAAALLAPIIGLAIVRPDMLQSWWNAYGRLAETYHHRDTLLSLVVLAPPDDRPRKLSLDAPYKHPRGANLTLLVRVPEGERPQGDGWVVPTSVYATRRSDGGGRQTLPAVKAGERQFRVAIDEVRDGMNLWVTGGDYTNAAPYRIDVVDAPRVERVELHNFYPAYTGLNDRDAKGHSVADRVVLTGPVAEVPAGTLVVFKARSNKPLRNARVRLGEMELVFGEFETAGGPAAFETRATFLGPGAGDDLPARLIALPRSIAATLIDEDRRGITIPLLVTHDAAGGGYYPDGAPDRPDLPDRFTIELPSQTSVRVTFEDVDRVASLDPSRFDLRGRPDEPPKVETQLRGVSTIITRTAVVPIQGVIRDDHGIAEARFDFKIDEAADWSPRPLTTPPAGLPKEFTLRRERETSAEWLDTATLNLNLGQKLTVAIAAVDGDRLTGPHIARGDQYVFTIVTAEELLSALYNQEINLRKRFEQSLGEMKAVRTELVDNRKRAGELRAGRGGENDVQAIRSAADRAFSETQQNSGEVRAIEQSFREILEQLVNNRVHTEKQLDRIRAGILDPLRRLGESRFPKLDRSIGELRLHIHDGNDTEPSFAAGIDAADELIAEMEAALKEMQDLAEFHEAIQELTRIFEDEEKLLDRTKNEQKRSVIDTLLD
ncbi:MAG: hypothetical protein WBC44_04150 [Planctomycetaceae bacterium]